VKSFASDNYAGAHPAVLEALVAANDDHARAYGADPWTQRVEARLADVFGERTRSFLVFNGTGANVLAIRATCARASAVVCAHTAHINNDEGGAPEWVAGVKLLAAPTADGKLTPADVEALCARQGDAHAAQPGLVSISQSTELGTLYTPPEIAALAEVAHARGMALHVDGSRLAHAAAALDLPLRALTTDVGVDVVSFGGTKVGMLMGEAVVFLRPELAEGFEYLRKQSLQLASKGRFIAAQFAALLENERWRALASHANAMASRLAAAVTGVEGVTITQAVQANAVFAIVRPAVTEALQADWPFYVWDESTGEVRWMCSWDTTEAEVDAFATAVRAAAGATVA
jgi:threonine aldolase